MSIPANPPQVVATLELAYRVQVTIPLPEKVTAEDIDDVASAADAIAALPPALKASLKSAAASADCTGTNLADIHYIWVC